MTDAARMEALSRAYLQAAAAACGLSYSLRSADYGIDLTLHEVTEDGGAFVESSVALDVQLKCTRRAIPTGTTFGFDLDRRTYDILRFESTTPRILAVLLLPAGMAGVRVGRSRLQIEWAMYWTSFRGHPASGNRRSVRVRFPRGQLFTPAAVRGIMKRTRPSGDSP